MPEELPDMPPARNPAQLMRSVVNRCLTGLLATALLVLVGCSIAPGLYDDTVPKSSSLEEGEALGGVAEVIPVTAELVSGLRRLAEENFARKRELSHRLYLENEALRESYSYKIDHTDVLSIVSWGHPELNVLSSSMTQIGLPQSAESIMLSSTSPGIGTSHEVDLNGYIFYPFIGQIKVSGLTIPETRALLHDKLSDYILDPQIDVSVSLYRSQRAYIVGEIAAPRTLHLNQIPLEVLDVITIVQGLTDQADSRNVSLIRGDNVYLVDLQAIIDGDLTQNYILQNQDVIVVPDNRFNSVFVLGEFDKTAQIVIPRTRFFSLADTITDINVGGFSDEIDSSRLFVFRYEDNGSPDRETDTLMPKVYHLDMTSAEAMLLAANFPIQPRDIVYAAPTDLSRWNRVVAQILPTIQATYLSIRTYWFVDSIQSR